ncbi:MAG: PleD family two-component system response regulator [Pyrinomonadaceae bacterium]
MIAGRKLLLADDSAAVQKVIELTFADEGMEVVSVGDGRLALEELEHVTPDVILADAFMPGLNGYELCRSIKDDERFAQIPVMLLVSSFAPFDEAAARSAGADDIMTKPFQSIRQLVNRVGSLLAANKDRVEGSPEHSTVELGGPGAASASVLAVDHPDHQANVTVLIEAGQLETAESHEPSRGACAPDIEFQTADTARLERVFDGPEAQTTPDWIQIQETIEIEPAGIDAETDGKRIGMAQDPSKVADSYESNMTHTQTQPRTSFDGALLDLDETDFGATSLAGDVVLDLDFEESAPRQMDTASSQQSTGIEDVAPAPPQKDDPSVTTHEVVSADDVQEPASADDSTPQAVDAASHREEGQSALTSGTLSAQTIDAIARRVIDQMSDKVLREIAWEVVPELAESLIKKKLEEQK